MNGEGALRGPRHAVFDRDSGRVLATFRKLDVASGEFVSVSEDEVLDLVRGDEEDAKLSVAAEVTAPPSLRLSVDREELEGNGEDAATISIAVVDESGKTAGGYSGPVHVSTTRGRLSARAGDVELENGHGSLTLTSVRETVDSVIVRATASDGSLTPGEVTLRFV
jgi:hypothetical protein